MYVLMNEKYMLNERVKLNQCNILKYVVLIG